MCAILAGAVLREGNQGEEAENSIPWEQPLPPQVFHINGLQEGRASRVGCSDLVLSFQHPQLWAQCCTCVRFAKCSFLTLPTVSFTCFYSKQTQNSWCSTTCIGSVAAVVKTASCLGSLHRLASPLAYSPSPLDLEPFLREAIRPSLWTALQMQ